ncbi:hypothetical protein J2X08_002261 [Rhizobium rosettiformans]|nr:hypothetical protein [Rhizobium rosettiformans]MDR7064776.1 hypothetical protein [Rhizobium rosettiformans]
MFDCIDILRSRAAREGSTLAGEHMRKHGRTFQLRHICLLLRRCA